MEIFIKSFPFTIYSNRLVSYIYKKAVVQAQAAQGCLVLNDYPFGILRLRHKKCPLPTDLISVYERETEKKDRKSEID